MIVCPDCKISFCPENNPEDVASIEEIGTCRSCYKAHLEATRPEAPR